MPISLKAARVNANLTQAEAAKELNIARGTLASYESYKTKPDIDTGKKIAALYKTEMDKISWNGC